MLGLPVLVFVASLVALFTLMPHKHSNNPSSLQSRARRRVRALERGFLRCLPPGVGGDLPGCIVDKVDGDAAGFPVPGRGVDPAAGAHMRSVAVDRWADIHDDEEEWPRLQTRVAWCGVAVGVRKDEESLVAPAADVYGGLRAELSRLEERLRVDWASSRSQLLEVSEVIDKSVSAFGDASSRSAMHFGVQIASLTK